MGKPVTVTWSLPMTKCYTVPPKYIRLLCINCFHISLQDNVATFQTKSDKEVIPTVFREEKVVAHYKENLRRASW